MHILYTHYSALLLGTVQQPVNGLPIKLPRGSQLLTLYSVPSKDESAMVHKKVHHGARLFFPIERGQSLDLGSNRLYHLVQGDLLTVSAMQ
jgi:hypothetical protein